MARGFKSAAYTTDAATIRDVRVEADRFADATFGWTASAAGAIHTGYTGLRPRHVVGVEAATGRTAKGIVPVTTADVWTGVATTFTNKDDDGAAHTYVITSRVGELAHILR
jgi:hypothetical protein